MASEIRFVVPGQAQAASPAAFGLGGQVLGSVRVGARRGAADSVRLTARPGEDMVVLSIANGPTLDAFTRFTADGERELRPDATILLVLAPFFCSGLIYATRRRLITSWCLLLLAFTRKKLASPRRRRFPWSSPASKSCGSRVRTAPTSTSPATTSTKPFRRRKNVRRMSGRKSSEPRQLSAASPTSALM